MLMVAKEEITGAEAVPRVPLVAERRVDSVPMGREGGRGAGGKDGEIRWGSGPGRLIPCRELDWGAIGHTSMGGGAFYYIGPAGLAVQGKDNSLDLHLLPMVTPEIL
jgi:hypothetical protein